MNKNIIPDQIIKLALEEQVNKIKEEIPAAIGGAVAEWYGSGGPGSYDRVFGFDSFAEVEPEERWHGIEGCDLVYTFTSGTVGVNSWEAPWGTTYPGDSGHAFDKAVNYGVHGGPRPNGAGGWSFANVPTSTPISDLIVEYINGIL